ncbi:amylosucrase [Pseudoclavibacter chungangensis]|uniref:Amylosucrase n=1 Tax=Pseudoclavibacter chungangensis TaxID=587635 RepID=A0A7J5C317_9MICO|nr:alpha-amylase family protein [Pseudoclavibacter chungangensis]KAB1662168.1 amylosucrase [Pseudoclavibacter chungangensis]NYJ65354.1 amylosucrase [Pseudoclavibacter chungangensis]
MTHVEDDPADELGAALERLGQRGVTVDADFERRVHEHGPVLLDLHRSLYGPRDGAGSFASLIELAAESWRDRPGDLRALDSRRAIDPDWFTSNRMLGGVCYVDRYAGSLEAVRERIPYFQELGLTYLHLMPLFESPEGDNDGGYAVSSYRRVDPAIGTFEDLAALAAELRAVGISLVVDFIFNHTSDEHEWARRAVAGDPEFENFYLIYPDRTMPDRYERTVREIFPDDHPGSFVQLPDGRWIWATFYHFQWDLDYSNPAVFRAMAGEMLFLANLGVEILRMDAVAFVWKRLGTPCESLPEVHLLLRAFNALLRIAAPSVLFKSEAIVHPDEVAEYISPDECQLSYNPLQMALTWEALATRDARLLQQALDTRHALPPGTAWIDYVRSHDDIGWTFADEDAAALGIDGYWHRRFLNDFYVGRFTGSFARGIPFQEHPITLDARIAGTAASLSGIEADDPGGEDRLLLAYAIAFSTGGIPLVYLGDEVAQLNDLDYADDPAHAHDARWAHRPVYPAERYAERLDPTTVPGRVFARFTRMLQVRRETPEFAGNELVPFHVPASGASNPVLGYQRPGPDGVRVIVLANVGDHSTSVDASTFQAFDADAVELLSERPVHLDAGVEIAPHGVLWIRAHLR